MAFPINWQLVGLAVAGYVLLCNMLRFQRMKRKHRQYPYSTREALSQMTVEHAQQIQLYIGETEFPYLFEKALAFALYKTYGIPSISSLLVATKQLSEQDNAPKRYTDTAVLISEFTAWAPNSERSCAAIARMNYLHSGYQKAGKISNDDLLYTLSLFALEPKRWINRFEWRQLTNMEVCALYVG